jgi:hypothetical protein
MICPHCGKEVEEVAKKDPWCMYQVKDGKVINQLFDPDQIPEGWYDSPKAAKLAAQKRKRRTKEEMKHDDSAGLNRLVS